MDRETRLMWTLEDWGMLLEHRLTEATSKRCMFYMGESILKLEDKQMKSELKTFKVQDTNEAALKDWAPFLDRDLEKTLGQPSNRRSAVYSKIKGKELKTIITLTDAKFEIIVESKNSNAIKDLHYNWELSLLMDEYITIFIEGKCHSDMRERLTKAMEILCTVDDKGLRAIRLACVHAAFLRLLKNMCKGMKNPFIAKVNERSALNRAVFFWRSDNGGVEAITHDNKMMMAAIRAVAMGLTAYPLHIAVNMNNLDAVVLLLANGVDPNARNEKGERPLFDALQYGFVNIVKALLLFGADPKKDVARHTPFHKAIHPDDKAKFEDVLKMIDDNAVYEQAKMEEFEKRRFDKALTDMEKALKEGADIHNLLSLDGGGIRGLVLIEIMDALEQKYGPALLDRFRWVAGTSTGAIMAIGLGQGKNVAECRRLYFRLKDLVFFRTTKLNPYPVEPLEKFLQREFSHSAQMSSLDNGASRDPQKRRKNVVVTTTECSETSAKLKLFRNFAILDQSKQDNNESMNTLAWEAALSSAAAPTYFPPVASKYVDGSLIANNPVLPLLRDFVACQEAVTLGLGSTPTAKPAKLGVVVSLGTGWKCLKKVKELEAPRIDDMGCQGCAVNVFGLPSYFMNAMTTYRQLLTGIKNQILRSEGSVNNARDWAFSMSGAFFRFNPSLKTSFALDETNNVLLIDLLWSTRVYMRQQKEYVDMFVELLHRTTKESDGKRSIMTQSTQDSHETVKREYDYENAPEAQYVDRRLREPDDLEKANHAFLWWAREELRNDPNVRARADFFDNDRLPLAIEPEVYLKYLEYAREEIEMDDCGLKEIMVTRKKEHVSLKARARFLEIERMPLAIEPEVKYIEYAREELEADDLALKRAQFFENDKLPLAIEPEDRSDDLPSPPSLDIPDIDSEDDTIVVNDYVNVPPKPARMI